LLAKKDDPDKDPLANGHRTKKTVQERGKDQNGIRRRKTNNLPRQSAGGKQSFNPKRKATRLSSAWGENPTKSGRARERDWQNIKETLFKPLQSGPHLR